jgi:rRNA maturation RNase YbeY
MVDVSIDVDHESLSVDRSLLERCLIEVLAGEGFSSGTIGVVLGNHEMVRELNRRYLGHDYDTDVLSFNLSEEDRSGDELIGEVYVDLDTANERCNEFNTSFEEEVYRYAIHGLLHIAGYQDDASETKEQMRQLENVYLIRAGLSGA